MSQLIVYPDAGTGNTTVDGRVYRIGVDEDWATITGGSGNGSSDTDATQNVMTIKASGTTNQWQYIFKSIYTFDVTALAPTDVINTAIFSIHGTGDDPGDAQGNNPDVGIYDATPANDNAIVNADYSTIGTTAQSDAVITLDDWDPSDYNDWEFNSAGRTTIETAISGDNIVSIGTRNANYDVAGSAPPNWADSDLMNIVGYTADQADTTEDPKLVINYNLAQSATITDALSMATPSPNPLRGLFGSFSSTISAKSSSSPIASYIKTFVSSISLTDVTTQFRGLLGSFASSISVKGAGVVTTLWTWMTEHYASWTHGTKNTTDSTYQTKNTTDQTYQDKS